MSSSDGIQRAAVIIPIVTAGGGDVLFIRRAAHLRRNADQVAFPGGVAEAIDGGDLRITALREFSEELGVAAACVHIVRRLPDALVVNRTVLVTPFIGLLSTVPHFEADPAEVAAVFFIPLDAIRAPGALHEGIERFDGRAIPTWQFDWNGIHVWGATARMLSFLLDVLATDAGLRSELRDSGVSVPSANPERPVRHRSET